MNQILLKCGNKLFFVFACAQNYRPCFSYAIGTPGDLSQPYEIINYSNKNALKWSSSYAAMYVYRLKVLDPNYR